MSQTSSDYGEILSLSSADKAKSSGSIVRAKTILLKSSASSGRAQPSDAPLSAHYSNIRSKSKNKRKLKDAETVLEYNILYRPRILKNDLRRQYPVMFQNVFNACDYNYMMEFLQIFCRPDIKGILESFEPNLYQKKEAIGFEGCGKEFFERMTDSPDATFNLKNIQMRVRSDGTCSLISKFELCGTKVLYVDPRRIISTMMKLAIIKSPDHINSIQENNNLEVVKLPSVPDPPTSSTNVTTSKPLFYSIENEGDIPDDYLVFDEVFAEAFEDYLQSESFEPSKLLTQSSLDTANRECSSSSDGTAQGEETDNDYLYRIFERAMNLDRERPKEEIDRKPEESLALAFPYSFGGDFVLQIDHESKVALTYFSVRVNR